MSKQNSCLYGFFFFFSIPFSFHHPSLRLGASIFRIPNHNVEVRGGIGRGGRREGIERRDLGLIKFRIGLFIRFSFSRVWNSSFKGVERGDKNSVISSSRLLRPQKKKKMKGEGARKNEMATLQL